MYKRGESTNALVFVALVMIGLVGVLSWLFTRPVSDEEASNFEEEERLNRTTDVSKDVPGKSIEERLLEEGFELTDCPGIYIRALD